MITIDSRYQKTINEKRQDWERELAKAPARTEYLQRLEQTLKTCAVPCEPISVYGHSYYVIVAVKRIPDILPVLDVIETEFELEFLSSEDSSYELARSFGSSPISVKAVVTEEGSCQRVVVRTERESHENTITKLVCS